MAKRRAGRWARQRVAKRRRQLVREHWRTFCGLFLGLLVVSVAAVALAGALFGSWLAWFIVGCVYAGALSAWLTMFELTDPETRHYARGADGEELTARELRRRSRHGWSAVHNVLLQSGDIDHIAIGPGGVIVVESKCPDAGWEWLFSQGHHRKWVREAARSAMRAGALVRQHSGTSVDARPVLVVWARGLAGRRVEIDGVTVLHGSELTNFLDDLPPVLDAHEVRRIHNPLQPAAVRMEAGVHARRAGFARA